MSSESRSDPNQLLADLDALLGPPPAAEPPLPAAPPTLPPVGDGEAPSAPAAPAAEAAAVAVAAPPAAVPSNGAVLVGTPGPLPEPEAPTDSAPAPEPVRPTRRSRVLVVEDDNDYRRVLRYLLTTNGFVVTEAGNGADGLKAARGKPHDLVLLDFEMPKMNGYEMIQELRRSDETRKMPIILLTGTPHRGALRGIDLDVTKFLEKPIANSDLLAEIARVLEGRVPVAVFAPDEPPPPEPAELAEPSAPAELAAGEAEMTIERPATLAPEPEPAFEEPPPPEAEELPADGDDLLIEEQKKDREEDVAGLDVLANDSPLVNRINRIFVRAVEMGASDVHIEPQEKAILVRVRVDGALQQLCRLPIALNAQVAARIKIMSNLTITERRRPQDGQIRAVIKGKKIEFRVSTIPSLYGEKIVLRILGGAKLKEKLEELQLSPRDLEVVRKALQSPHGLLLVTGPTGSGKSTTLYTMLRQLNKSDVNIVTAEDPVEYELNGITQVPVKAHIGVTFEAILRSFLRQDPDIMLVGEIRDLETAEIAVKAAITGHLVMSTLHTNSAPAAVMRLTHMGLAPYLVADAVKLLVAQRLVRRICRHCRTPAPADEEMVRLVGEAERPRLSKACIGKGCANCSRTGYAGRMPLFEVMEIRTPEMRHLILEEAGVDKVAAQAEKEGMTSLRQAALAAVAAGDTTVEEALNILLSE
ncbi:MAG: Flp pilus assembly complex ATPase component TadA [Elusimicrobia bacterium]|nr:Flp pilus assembly complex ATPase component TadA [Elusimicrobiota bacterium]